jgi:type IV secretion system protein VirB10
MATDPFQKLPTIEDEPHHVEPSIHHPTSADQESPAKVAASAPQRNLIKSATKLAVPIFGLSVAAWLFLTPDQPHGKSRIPAQKVDVDTTQQAGDSASLVTNLKSDAYAPKKPAVTLPVMPGSSPVPQGAVYPSGAPTTAQATAATGAPAAGTAIPAARTAYTPAAPYPAQPSLPGGMQQPSMPAYQANSQQAAAAAELAQKQVADRLKRQEEVRSSPLEVPSVRLLNQQSGPEAAKAPMGMSELQSELAGITAQRTEAANAQQSMQNQILASLAVPKEQAKSRGVNEDFIASTAANSGATSAANAAHSVLKMQGPVANSMVAEGTVIRSVLLTNVKSEMPGRILARVTSDVYDSEQRYVVIPKGSIINGVYNSQVTVGQERLLVAMTKLTLPNGNWIPLAGSTGTDMMGTSGLQAEVNNHFFKIFSSSLVIGASTLLLPKADTTVTALPGNSGNGGAPTAGSIFATTLQGVLASLLDRNKNIAPSLSLNAGQEFLFMATQDMVIPPYQ